MHFFLSEWHGGEVNLIALNRSSESSKYEVTILVDAVLTTLSMGQNTAADLSVYFEVSNTAVNKENELSGPITAVRRLHKFIFTLMSNGIVCILFLWSELLQIILYGKVCMYLLHQPNYGPPMCICSMCHFYGSPYILEAIILMTQSAATSQEFFPDILGEHI